VYLNYGLHYLVNVVTEGVNFPAAVLIRALEPVEGVAVMRRRRTRDAKDGTRGGDRLLRDEELCRGPGNLTRAMGITLAENRLDLSGDRLFVEDRRVQLGGVVWGPRIGVNVGTGRPWRVYVAGHPAVSGRRAS
jgi:DNA-3-methyladenine glycosylase